MSEFKISLGSEVTDKVTGFKGVVIGRTEWLYGCRRYSVQPKGITKEGKTHDAVAFDEDALTVTKAFKKETVRETGGPNDNERGMARGREVRR